MQEKFATQNYNLNKTKLYFSKIGQNRELYKHRVLIENLFTVETRGVD